MFSRGIILITQAYTMYILESFDRYTISTKAASQDLRITALLAIPIFALNCITSLPRDRDIARLVSSL